MSGHLNSSPPFIDQHNEDQHSYLIFNSNLQASSSSSLSSRTQDQSGYYHSGMQQSNNLASRGRSYRERSPGLELCLWKKEDINENENENENNSVKWMSSKVRFMQKLKKSDHLVATDHVETPTITTQKCDDQKLPSSSMEVHDNINCSIPVRVCADCNTTKTPLWRSGPRGPKSLCNACGIRQRKARRAMAAAANGTIVAAQASSKKTKVQQKDKKWNNGHAAHAQCKKSSKLSIQSDHGRKKLRFEDFLISLSENLAIHRVFPQDEKEAAILLMALSCGLVHG